MGSNNRRKVKGHIFVKKEGEQIFLRKPLGLVVLFFLVLGNVWGWRRIDLGRERWKWKWEWIFDVSLMVGR